MTSSTDSRQQLPQAATAAGARPPRLHGLDALRGGALLLGIVLHARMPFLPGGGWLVADSQTSGLADPVVFVG